MKRCTAVLRTTCSWQARRWASHDKATLTKEALLRQVEAGLGQDHHGNPLRVDTDSKTVSTAAGDLPISPLFDPAWIRSRRRQRKDEPAKPLGRFRKKLALNPYARALATPIRICSLTSAAMPRYFLQDFELVSHPTTGEPWVAPGPLAFEKIEPSYYPSTSAADTASTVGDTERPVGDDGELGKSAAEAESSSKEVARGKRRPRRAPVTGYTLSRKAMLDPLGPGNKALGGLLGPRNGAAWSQSFRQAVFRKDMSEFILKAMRRLVVDTLITRAGRVQGPKNKFVEPVPSWDGVKNVRRRQSVLWLPHEASDGAADAQEASEYATLDVDGVQYNRKMAVHNLSWLLGSEEVARLRDGAPEIFGKHQVLVLKSWGSHSMVNLHLLLWRLHGYLASTRGGQAA